ncbi:MAG: TorF family putative porin [Beijerinckiaceae bacterium]
MRLLAAAAALVISSGAYAADPAASKAEAPPPAKPLIAWPEPNFDVFGAGFDYAVGVKMQTDYISRGISQTAHRPSATAYGELRYGWLYAGVQPWNVSLPTRPLAELDVYGGIRPTWGPLTLDVGIIGYLYPRNQVQYFLGGTPLVNTFWTPGGIPTTARDPSYFEIYGKTTWALNDYLTIGTSTYYTPNWNNYGNQGLYNELNAKVTFGETGFSVSGAFGHSYLGQTNWRYGYSYVNPGQWYQNALFGTSYANGLKFASYNSWNLGASYTYKALTFDLRYYGSSMGQVACALNSSDPAANLPTAVALVGRSNWCGNRIVAALSIDFTSATFK